MADFHQKLAAIREKKQALEREVKDLNSELSKLQTKSKESLRKYKINAERKKKLEDHIRSTKDKIANQNRFVSVFLCPYVF
jgi:peptidoglycan hydrolase CwlO-like protein